MTKYNVFVIEVSIIFTSLRIAETFWITLNGPHSGFNLIWHRHENPGIWRCRVYYWFYRNVKMIRCWFRLYLLPGSWRWANFFSNKFKHMNVNQKCRFLALLKENEIYLLNWNTNGGPQWNSYLAARLRDKRDILSIYFIQM